MHSCFKSCLKYRQFCKLSASPQGLVLWESDYLRYQNWSWVLLFFTTLKLNNVRRKAYLFHLHWKKYSFIRGQHFWDSRTWRRRKKRGKSPFFLSLSLSPSSFCNSGPRVLGRKLMCSFGHCWGECRGALLYSSWQSILLQTYDESVGPIVCPLFWT